MGKEKETPAPIRQSVHVDCAIEDAFRLFTEGFAEWWPLASCSVAGDEAEHCAIEPWVGGKVFERTRSGEEREWGSVTIWDPPKRVEFSWRLFTSERDRGGPRNDDQTVTVDFRVEADGTRVTLTHRGWQWAGVATCASRFAGYVCEQMLVAV
jgi:Activator of Hsp90 ATPase homolog 1-like protein